MPTPPDVTPNLGLFLPTPGVALGPDWAQYLNANFQTLDELGNPVVTSQIDINADLTFNGFSAIDLKSTQYQNLSGPLGSGFTATVYFSGGNFYINNGSGTPVQITNGSSVNAGSGNIAGLPSTPSGAACTYSNANGFTFVGYGGNNYAPLAMGGLTLYSGSDASPSNAVSLLSPNSLAASYSLTMPAAAPSTLARTSLLAVSTAGVESYATPDNSTIVVSGGVVAVGNGGIGTAQLASQAVTAAKIANNTIGAAQVIAPVPFTLSPSWSLGWSGSLIYWTDINGFVHLRGSLTRGSIGLFGPAAFPAFFRPLSTRGFALGTDSAPGSLTIQANGDMTFEGAGTGTTVFFDAVSFLWGV